MMKNKQKNLPSKKGKTYAKKNTMKSDAFIKSFSKECYLDGAEYDLPDWVFDYREEFLSKPITRNKQLYQILQDNHIDFKIKYPVCSNGKWKFADVYLPKQNLVILIMNRQETLTPVCSMYDRTEHFKDHHKVEMILPEEIKNVMKVVSKYAK